MSTLAAMESLYEDSSGERVPLPAGLERLYGELRFPEPAERAYIIANFVTTLDGVVALEKGGGGQISGYNPHDRLLMGILRAVADAVIVGAGTLRPDARHLWTAEAVYPPMAEAYRQLRRALGKPETPLNVIVTASGDLEPDFRVFRTDEVPVLVLTTDVGAKALRARGMSERVRVVALQDEGTLEARSILNLVGAETHGRRILVEGGPHLMADFFAAQCVDELFYTIAPQIAGRDGAHNRPGLVAGQIFAPDAPQWGTLVSVKRADSHLFLRYNWETAL